MRDVLFWLATVAYAVTIGWAFMNRDSEKVVTTLYLGVSALFGVLLAISVFGSEPPIRKVFSAPIFIDAKTRLPFEGLPYSVLPWLPAIQARDKLTADPDLIPAETTDPFAHTLYHQLLQRAIVDWLEEKYPKTWKVDVYPMNLGDLSGYTFQSREVPSRLYSAAELTQKMAGNKFADLPGPFGAGGNYGLAVPLGTTLEISPPHMDRSIGQISSLKLQNHYCTITIETREAMSMVGAGWYRVMLGMTQNEAQQAVATNQYTIIVSATFSRLLAGHPDMPEYKRWASDIASGLEAQFDERVMWSRSKDWLLLNRDAKK